MRTEKENLQTLDQIVKENKLSLKNIKMFNGHDGVGLSCDLYINNKKVAYCFDDARGGEMEITPLTFVHRSSIDALLLSMLKYPKYILSKGSGNEYSNRIEDVINHMVSTIEEEKELKKLSKKAIVFKTPAGETWLKSWNNLALPMLIAKKGELGKTMISEACKEIESKGNVILNKHYLKLLDINV